MRNLKTYKKILLVVLASALAVICVAYVKVIFSIPGELVLIEGEEYIYNFNSPFTVNIKADQEGIIKLNGGNIEAAGSNVQLNHPVTFKTVKDGNVILNMKIFGLLPVKTVKVDIVSYNKIAACGNTIGVKLKLDGILVIGISDVETTDGKRELPSRDSGIKPGYVITQINGKQMKGIEDLVGEIEKSGGNPIKIKYRYGSLSGTTDITPVKMLEDKKYHIGLWVRDSTAGIGTLTFYDPDTNTFGALGHGITDIDTGTLMPVESGEILESSILGIKMGKQGTPGELKGVFIDDTKLGNINVNSEFGIYGKLNPDSIGRISARLYPVGVRADIKEGPATILSNIDGKNIDEYSIDIQKISKQNLNGSKGMVIKITDPRLLDATGGIVQGMSGSPIIQDGKIIGAVTHVLVNDPTRGYGIFIENMLKNMAVNCPNSLAKAG